MSRIAIFVAVIVLAVSCNLAAQTTVVLDNFESGTHVMNPADPLAENANLWAQYPGCKLSGTQCGGIAAIVSNIFHGGSHSINDHIISAGFTANGSGATFNITESGATYNVTLNQPGSGFVVGDTVNIRGDAVGGARLTNDVTITVSAVNGSGAITSFLSSGVAVGTSSYSGVAAYAYLPQSYFEFSPESDSGSTGYSAPNNGWGLMHNFTSGGDGRVGTPSPAWVPNNYNRMQMWVKIPQQNQLGLASNDSSGFLNAPQNLQLSRTNNGTQMNVTWAAPAIGAPTSYTITRCTGAGCTLSVPDLTHTVSGSTLSYNDTGLNPNTNYSYQIAATDNASHSSFNQILEQQGILQLGTYVRPQYCADPDPPDPDGDPDCVTTSAQWNSTSDNGAELGGGHWYHFFAVPATTEWYQLVLDTHPSHFRGGPGAQEWGDQTYPTLTQSDYVFPSSGSSATFNVTESGGNYAVTVDAAGSGYSANNKLVLLGTSVGGTSPTNDVFITVSSVNGGGGVTGITSSGASTGSSSQTGVAAYSNECYEPPIVGSTVLPLSSQTCANTVQRDTTWNYFDGMTRFYLDFYNDGYTLPTAPADYYFDDFQLYKDPNTANINITQVYSLGGVWVPSSDRIHVGWQHPKNDGTTCHEVAYAFQDVFTLPSGFSSATPAPNGHICPQAGPYAGMVYDTSAIDKTGHSVIYIAIQPDGASTFNEIAISLSSDTTSPSAPASLSANPIGDTQISLSWTASTDDVGVAGYSVERCQGVSCSNFVAVATVSGTTYNDTGLSVSTVYSYRVRAIDTSYNYGPYSNAFTPTTTADNAPTAPTNLSAAPASGSAGAGEIVLTWTAASDDVAVTGYLIYRCVVTSCSFAQVGTAGATTTYTDSGLTPGVAYSYKIAATNASTNSANTVGPFSNTTTVTTTSDTTPPSALNGLTATAASSSQINLSWGRLQPAVVRYYINEASSGATPTQLIDSGGIGSAENLATNYGGGNMAYAGDGQPSQHGLASTSLTGSQGASITLTSSDKVVTQMTGADQATMEFIIQANAFSPTDTSIFGMTSSSNPAFFVRVNSSNTWQLFWRGTFVAQWTASASTRSVFDIVVDSTQSQSSNQVVVYQNGATIPVTVLNGTITQNTDSGVQFYLGNLTLMNSNFGSNADRSPQGTLYYAAIYNTALSSSAVSANYNALIADDDTVGATDNVGVTGYDIVRCVGGCTPSIPANVVATVGGSALSYSDTGLSSSTSYTYSVNAFDAAANTAANSNVATATTNAGGGGTATSTSVSPNNATVTYGVSQTFTATVTASGPVTVGTVTFVDTTTSTTLASNVALNGSGQATATVVVRAGANQTIQATYNPTGIYNTSSNTTSVTVNKAALTVSATSVSSTYGSGPAYSATFSGFVNGDTSSVVTGSASFNTNATLTNGQPNVGSWTITPSQGGLSASNYTFGTFNTGTLTVNKASLTVTANAATVTYGAAFPTFAATITGFVNSDTSAVVSGTPTFSNNATTTSGNPNAGSWTITPAAGTLAASNYNFTTLNTGTLTVNKVALTVTANAQSVTYPAAFPTFAATTTGFVNGDTSAVVSGTPTFSTNATTTNGVPNAGSWTITPAVGTISASNYTFSFATGALNVAKSAVLTVTATAQTVTYGSTGAYTATISGFVNGDTSAAVSGSAAFATNATLTNGQPNVGSWTITPSQGGLSANNYTFATFNTGSLTVNKAPLTVTANAATVTYGAAFPTFAATITGFVNSDASTVVSGTPTFSNNATTTSGNPNAGSWTITPAAGTLAASNYNFTTLNTGTLTVNKVALTVTANAQSVTYPAAFPTFAATTTGFVNGDTSAVVSGTPTFSTNATTTNGVPNAGSWTITPAVGTISASNYTFSFATGALNVAKSAVLTVTANAQTVTYGSTGYTATITGFVNGDTSAVVLGSAAFTTNGTLTNGQPNAGSWTITPSQGTLSATNYTFSNFNSGALTVNQAVLMVTAVNQAIAVGILPTYTATINGFVNGDTSAVVSGSASFSTNATIISGAPAQGTWTITPAIGTLSAINYSFTFVNGTLRVNALSATPSVPVVSISSPASGVPVSGTVTVSATASSSIGIASVLFQLDGANLGSILTSSPYTVTWDTTQSTNGSHSLSATAQDTLGQQSTSMAVVVTVSNMAPTTPVMISSGGGGETWTTTNTDANASQVTITHGDLQSFNSGSLQINTASFAKISRATSHDATSGNTLAGVAVIGLSQNGVLVTESGVPASPQILGGRMYDEIQGAVDTGIAMSNETGTDATISFYFTNAAGQDTNSGSFTLQAGHQISAFLNQAPFNGPSNIQGTFTFTSSSLVGAIGLRCLTNERGEFLVANLPIATLNAVKGQSILPQFADGGGWTTDVVLTNNSDAAMSGTLQFVSPGTAGHAGQPLTINVNGVSAASFGYSVPAHGAQTFLTSDAAAATQVGSVQISATTTPDGLGSVPSATAIFLFRNGSGITVTEASVIATPADNAFRVYVEASGTPGQIGSIQSGLAVANTSTAAAVVNVSLTSLNGTSLGMSQSISVPAGGQIAEFFNEIFPQLSANGQNGLQAVARVTSSTPIAVTALRGRYNERGDYLISTAPPLDESTPASNLVFPQIVSGMGYTTQIVIFGTGGSGNFYLLTPAGTTLPASALSPE